MMFREKIHDEDFEVDYLLHKALDRIPVNVLDFSILRIAGVRRFFKAGKMLRDVKKDHNNQKIVR